MKKLIYVVLLFFFANTLQSQAIFDINIDSLMSILKIDLCNISPKYCQILKKDTQSYKSYGIQIKVVRTYDIKKQLVRINFFYQNKEGYGTQIFFKHHKHYRLGTLYPTNETDENDDCITPDTGKICMLFPYYCLYIENLNQPYSFLIYPHRTFWEDDQYNIKSYYDCESVYKNVIGGILCIDKKFRPVFMVARKEFQYGEIEPEYYHFVFGKQKVKIKKLKKSEIVDLLTSMTFKNYFKMKKPQWIHRYASEKKILVNSFEVVSGLSQRLIRSCIE